ncbi:PTS sugar transporter subunit IIA [Listeria kieliensis]
MNNQIFNEANIVFDETATTQTGAFEAIAWAAYQNGYVKSAKDFVEALKLREQESTTGFKDGIAIPHGKSETVVRPGLILVKYKSAIEWQALDQKPVQVALALTIPVEGASEHLKILSLIARKLIDDGFRETLITAENPAELVRLMDEIEV